MASALLIVLSGFFFTGLLVRTKSLVSGRKGPGIFQPVFDIVRLLRKGMVIGRTSSMVFQAAPAIYLASVLSAILVVPFGHIPGVFSFPGDFVFFAYILALGKFFCIIAALDTGSSFEGMGASREALFSLLAEPAFFLLMGTLSLLTGDTSFHAMFAALHFGSYTSYLLGGLAASVLLVIAMIENSRMPVDDPDTHLELTMIHEVMILDNSGFDLGLILSAAHLKFAMYGALIAGFFIGEASWPTAILLFLSIQSGCAVAIGLAESFMARFRMNHNPQFIFALTSVALLILFGAVVLMGKF